MLTGINPLTPQGGKAAAEAMLAMRKTGDYSRASTRQYERAWMRAYGHDFSYVRARLFCLAS